MTQHQLLTNCGGWRYQNMKERSENRPLSFTLAQLVNHGFLRGLEWSHAITACDPDGSDKQHDQKG